MIMNVFKPIQVKSATDGNGNSGGKGFGSINPATGSNVPPALLRFRELVKMLDRGDTKELAKSFKTMKIIRMDGKLASDNLLLKAIAESGNINWLITVLNLPELSLEEKRPFIIIIPDKDLDTVDNNSRRINDKKVSWEICNLVTREHGLTQLV